MISSFDGISLWTTSDGEGPLTILLSNGGPGCHDYLAPLAALLGGTGRRIVRWEQRGVGRSGGDRDGPFTIQDCVADMQALRRAYGGEQWVLAGHSWGADLSLICALADPAACMGLLCVAGGRFSNDRAWHAEYDRDKTHEVDLELAFNSAVNAQLNAEYQRYVQRPTLFADVAALSKSALFLYGAADVRPSWPVEQIAALMPQGEYRSIQGAGHYLYLTHAAEVRDAVDTFLRDLTARS